MGILVWLLLGLVAGWIANMIMSSGRGGLLTDIITGIVGALVGGFIGSALFGVDVTGFNISSILLAVLGAVVVIALYRAVTHQPIRE
ncbi:MAG TPA: GlsB/YeaQ/YmgE family stress response membrane protein [Chloroflexia bacterium]|nr:GlsB/YeaQ/YmgE family stress response membrane protein [Chloroflexia bacterium]